MYRDRELDEGRESWNLKAVKGLKRDSCRLATNDGKIEIGGSGGLCQS